MAVYGDNAPETIHLCGATLEGAAARFARHLIDHDNSPIRPALLGFGKDSGERVLATLRAARVLKFDPTITNSMATHRWRLTDEAYAEARA